MFKTRGKPEDPWNLAAVEQNKALAATIHVNQIHRNGTVPHTHSEVANRIQCQQELQRRRQHYQDFKDRYHDKMRQSTNNVPECLKQQTRHQGGINYNHDVQIMKRFVGQKGTNDHRGNNDAKGLRQPAMLRAPLRAVKTVNVEVPGRYTGDAILCPPKFGEGESLMYYDKLKEYEKLKEKVNQTITAEQDTQTSMPKELEQASIEVDIGKVQLEEINKILHAKRTQRPCVEDANNVNLYNVKVPQQKTPFYKVKSSVKEAISGKKKLLLTLNDVQERIQKLQVKFFNNSRPRYKSVENVLKPHAPLQVLYKNANYNLDNTSAMPTVQRMHLDLSSLEQSNLNSPRPHSNTESYREPEKIIQQIPNQNNLKITQEVGNYCRPHTTEIYKGSGGCIQKVTNKGLLNKQIQNRNRRDELKYQNNKRNPLMLDESQFSEIPNAGKIGDHAQRDVAAHGSQKSPARYNNHIFEDNCAIKNAMPDELDYPSKIIGEANCKDIGTGTEVLFNRKLQDTIFKSDFLMKEFDINLKDMSFNMNKLPSILESKRSSKKNAQPYITPLQKLRKERTPWDNNKVTNSTLYTPMLTNTLYSVTDS